MNRAELLRLKRRGRTEIIGDLICAAMKHAELTPRLLAKLLTERGRPTTHVAVRAWVAGRYDPRPETMAEIEQILNLDLSPYV